MSISFKVLCAVWCVMYVRILYHQYITIVGITSSSVGNEIICSQHYSLDTRKVCKGPRCFLAPEGPHWGLDSLFATGCVLRGFITARQLHTARSGPDLLPAKSDSCNAEHEKGNTGMAGLLFIELAGSGMTGIKPELRSSVLQSCLGLCTELPSIFKHGCALNGVVVPHRCVAHVKFPCNPEYSRAQHQQPGAPELSSGLSEFICSR